MRFSAAVFCFTLLSSTAYSQDRYLVPVFANAPGAHGSVFASGLSLFNPGTPVTVRGLRFACVTLCPPERPFAFTANTGATYVSFDRSGRPGLIISAEEGADLRMTLRVRDTSRHEFSAGTEIPIVRESEMIAGPAFLVDVPPEGSRFRNRVRVYAFTPGQVRVVHVRSADNAVLHETTLQLNFPVGVPPEERDFYPAFAESAEFPVAESSTRVQVEPIGDIGRLWAFVTSTNNDTQEITLVTPQP